MQQRFHHAYDYNVCFMIEKRQRHRAVHPSDMLAPQVELQPANFHARLALSSHARVHPLLWQLASSWEALDLHPSTTESLPLLIAMNAQRL